MIQSNAVPPIRAEWLNFALLCVVTIGQVLHSKVDSPGDAVFQAITLAHLVYYLQPLVHPVLEFEFQVFLFSHFPPKLKFHNFLLSSYQPV